MTILFVLLLSGLLLSGSSQKGPAFQKAASLLVLGRFLNKYLLQMRQD
jgi:hypothetical protein